MSNKKNNHAFALFTTVILLIISLPIIFATPVNASIQRTQIISRQGQIIPNSQITTTNGVYQDNALLSINGVTVFLSGFTNGFPDPYIPYTDSCYTTAAGIVFNGTYASFWQKPYDASSPTIFSYTKTITLNAQNLRNFKNFFWIIGNDQDRDYFGLKIQPTGNIQYMWNGGSSKINTPTIEPTKINYITTSAYYNSSSNSYWGNAAVTYINGTSAVFNSIALPYQPNFYKYKLYVDGMTGSFTAVNTLQTNATTVSFCSTVRPALNQFQITTTPPQNLTNSLSATVFAVTTGWSGYSGLNYWGYDTANYLSPPSAGKISYTTQTTDDSMWTNSITLDQSKRWVYFGAWLYINGKGTARIGIDFRDSNYTIIKGAASYSLLTPGQWTYVEVWALAPASAVKVTPWVQYNQGGPGNYTDFDNATLSFASNPTILNLQVYNNAQVTLQKVLLSKDWYTVTT